MEGRGQRTDHNSAYTPIVPRPGFVVGLALASAVLLPLPTLEAQSDSPSALAPAVAAAKELPRLHSLLVAQRGTIILERYFNGRRETTPANVKSVSKSVISALVGIAVDRKLLSLDDPIAKYFPDLPEPKRAITDRAAADHAVGARVDEQSELRRVGAELELGASCAGEAAAGRAGHADDLQHRQLRTSCRRSSRKRRERARGSSRRRRSRSRSASRCRRGCAIRRASTSAATRW